MTTAQNTDWQVSHTEQSGKVSVVIDFNTDPDDQGATQVVIRGRAHADVAERLAKLLQEHGFVA